MLTALLCHNLPCPHLYSGQWLFVIIDKAAKNFLEYVSLPIFSNFLLAGNVHRLRKNA